MLNTLKRTLIHNIKNVPGWRTDRKILVIEADDFGGIRNPIKKIYDKWPKKGLKWNGDRFDRFDTLANKQDLEAMFEVLRGVRDHKGNPAVVTPIINVANPDFNKIKLSGFKEYHLEPFTQSLKRYYGDHEPFPLWLQGLDEGFFLPEYHGREHICVQIWLEHLQKNNKDLLKAFDCGYVPVHFHDHTGLKDGLRAEFFFNHPNQIGFLHQSIRTGVQMFYDLLGFMPIVFVPGNSIFHPVFEKTLHQQGIRYLNVNHFMKFPDGHGGIKKKYRTNHSRSKYNITYYARNCVFEPTDPLYKGIGYTLKQIEAAFRWKKPVIISTHRVNFVGGIFESNRRHGLKELRQLLEATLKRWPQVEFMGSAQMLNEIENR